MFFMYMEKEKKILTKTLIDYFFNIIILIVLTYSFSFPSSWMMYVHQSKLGNDGSKTNVVEELGKDVCQLFIQANG